MTILDRDHEIDALLLDLTKARDKRDKADPVWKEFDTHIDTVLVLIAAAGGTVVMQQAVDVYGDALEEIANPQYGCGFNALRKRAKKALRDVPSMLRTPKP